jgi:zinc transport system ATP-binding protein
VLSNIKLDIHRGDYLGLVGGNGAGKTTLLKLILGLLTPKNGTIQLFGQDIRSFKDWSKVGYVPQKATAFDANFPATVEEVVLMGRYGRRGLFRRITTEDREKALEAIQQVDMLRYRNTLIGDLSGGEQQRVFIARALKSRGEASRFSVPISLDQRFLAYRYR